MKSARYGVIAAGSLALLIGLIISCKSLPPVEAESPQQTHSILIRDGAQGVAQRSIASVSREIATQRSSDLLQQHLAAIARAGEPLPINDNEVRLLIDGPQTFDDVFRTVAGARNTINLEMYIFEDDEIGNRLKALLIAKRREGVNIKVIYDSLGCISTPKAFFQQMIDAGIQVAEFNPVNLSDGKLLNINNRDHRKLLVVDGSVAFTGGINISSVYSRGSGQWRRGSSSKTTKVNANQAKALNGGWRDTQIEVRGPAVAAMQRVFFDTWNSLTNDRVERGDLPAQIRGAAETTNQSQQFPQYYPRLNKSGDKIVRVIANNADDETNIIYTDFLSAIRTAQRDIHITMAYFSPDEQILDGLCSAAKRHVDVQLVLPGFSDIWLIFEAGRSHYGRLLKCGVKIYERHDALLHAKTVVIDGVWSTVGSSNMDMRSFLHNNELNVVVLGSDFGTQMEALFKRDTEQATLVTRHTWAQRPLVDRMRQWFASVFSYWL